MDPNPPIPLTVLFVNSVTSSKETTSGLKNIICAILSPILISTSQAVKFVVRMAMFPYNLSL